MSDNEAGAFLNITPDVLKKLDSFDEKLEKIEKHAHTAADALKNGFGSVVVDTRKLESAIASLASKIGALNTTSNSVGNIGTAAQGSARGVSSMNESLTRAAWLLNQIGNIRIGQNSFSGWNIAELKEGISDIKKFVENTKTLSKAQQQQAVEAMRYMKMELDYQRQTDEQRVQSAEKTAQRKEAADRRAAKAAEQLARQQEIAQRTTPQGALDYSRNAKYLRDQVTAINYLKQARLSLNTTDANYRQTLEQINQAIAKHNQALQQAGVQSQQLATRHRNLMDTAGQLSRQLALVFSVSQIEGYISKLANVRGEFELQQRSLEAILQNKAQADQIFNKTVQLAVKSPFQIKELVTFTKQLAAYRIESDKLYDTTKRLADVSAGLGVDMGRLILAYGQVKAAAYLRGTEVRQFTEAGINLYGELQRYFEEVKGEAYTTAQIVDMISKRKVTFEDIENIFKRLTDSGGLFYNMQEIQAETLQGKISNLKDSIDVMLNSIGKANEDTLKGTIDAVKVLIDNWETVANVGKTLAEVIISLIISYKILNESFGTAAKNAMMQAKHFGILKGMMVGLSGQATKLGASLKTAFLGAIPLLGLTTAIELFSHLISVQREYSKAQKEADNKYYKGQVRVSEIENLSVTLDEKTSKPKIKEALNALVKEMNNEGFNIEIKANLSEKEAKQQYDDLLKQHKDYLDAMLVLDQQYNLEKKNNSWFFWQEDYEDVDKNLGKIYTSAVSKIPEMQSEIAKLLKTGTGIDDTMREELKSLEQGVKESGSLKALQDYYNKLEKLLNKIKKTIGGDVVFAGDVYIPIISETTFAGVKSNILEGVRGITETLDKSGEKMKEKVRDIFTKAFSNKSLNEDAKVALATRFINENSEIANLIEQILTDEFNLDFTKKTKTDNKNEPDIDTKLQRDILAERISLIKELNKEYEKLNKVMGSDKAAKTVMERYASQLKDVQMPKNIIGEAFLPNKENTAKALQELAKIITDFRKRIGAEKDANVLFDEKDADDLKEQLENTKKNIESMFNSLDLHQKLKDAGLSEAEVQQLFPGLAKTLDDVQKGIEAEYQKKFPKGEYLIADTDANKQYLADLNKLNQQRIKDSQDLVIELTKAYKTQLSDQLQLDMWYYKERSKIYTKVYDEQTKTFKDVLTKEMQEQYSKNLKAQYDKKSSENTWKAFKGTDTYMNMFDNLENVSTKAIENMKAKLETLKEQMKELDPSQLKEVMNFYNKMDEQLFKRSPLESFLKSYEKIKELKSQGITEEGLLQRIAENDIENTNLQQQISDLNTIIALKKESIEKDSVESSFIEKNKDLYNQSISVLESMVKAKQDTINDNNKENENANKNLKYFKDARSSLEYMKSAWDSVRNAGRQAMGSIVSILETMGEDTDSTSMRLLNIVGTIGDLVIQAVMFQLQLGLCTEAAKEMGVAMNAALGPIGWVLIALQAVATILSSIFGNHDKDLQKEIEEHERKIKKLEREYDKLKESIDNVWDITKLQEYGNELDENINKQIVSLNAMIAAERDKKDTDWDKINEWQEQIEDLRDTLADSANDMIAELGGVGSDENFKTLAENFASAWLEAFQETGDGLSGLQESFDDFMENYVKQQILLRLSDKFLKPMFEEFDSLIATRTDMEQEDQERYFELQAQITKLRNTANNSVVKSVAKKANAAADEIENSEEYKRLQKAYTDFLKPNDINTEAIKDWSDKMKEVFGEYNEAAEEIFNQIGWEPGGKANLSALTQGITQISEETANELSAILNSVRFFVANQTSDITAIRNILETEFLSSGDGSSNPMLIELKSQTEYLKLMSDNFESILSYSGNSKGRGIRVFIQ